MFGVSRAEFKRLQERIDRLEERLEYLEYFEEKRQAWKRAKNAGRGEPQPAPDPSYTLEYDIL